MKSLIYLLCLMISTPISYSLDFNSLQLETSLGHGKSSNLAKSNEEALEGKYFLYSVKLLGEYQLSNTNQLLYHVMINGKKHENNVYAKNFDEQLYGGELGNQLELKGKQLLGFQGHWLNYKGRIVDYESNSVEGRENKFLEFGGAIVYQKVLELWQQDVDFMTKIFILKRDYHSLANDENGNLFEDDFNAGGLAITSDWHFSKRLAISLKPQYQKKKYQFRRSRYTEGSLDNSKRNPLQDLSIWKIGGKLAYEGEFTKSYIELQLSQQDDIKLGALDYQGHQWDIRFEWPFLSIITLRPKYIQAKHEYESFVADVINNPTGTEKRVDKFNIYAIDLDFDLNKFKVSFHFQKQRIDSNYSLEGFHEKKYELEFTYAFL